MRRKESSDPPSPEIDWDVLLGSLRASGDAAPGIADKIQMLRSVRGLSEEASNKLDELVLREGAVLRAAAEQARKSLFEMKAHIDKLTAPPWHPAVLLARDTSRLGPVALCAFGGTRRVVLISDEVEASSLAAGDEVLLSTEMNAIVGKSPFRSLGTGQTATFDRYTPDGRLLIRWRDEEMIVDAAPSITGGSLKAGDLLLWNQSVSMAIEKLPHSQGEQLFLEETPRETFDDIGGASEAIEKMQRALRLHIDHPDRVTAWGLPPVRAVLMVGPPGVGKTMMARAVANWVGSLRGGRARFLHIKPGALNSMWFGESERNVREAFRVARQAAEREPGVPSIMFFDEIDGIAQARGSSLMQTEDRVLNSLMVELEGLESRGDVFVIAASNRADSLDEGLVRAGRLGDCIIRVPRPNRAAAKQILAKHIREGVPLELASGEDEAGARDALFEALLARLFSRNGQSDLATAHLRDGSQRAIRPADLMSGAALAKVAREAKQRALVREIDTGERGLRLEDLLTAADQQFSEAAQLLTPANCRRTIASLPQDTDVVRIEHAHRTVPRPYRHLRVA